MSIVQSADWWLRPDLCYRHGQLYFAGRSVAGLSRQFGTPSFVYSAQRIRENLLRLHDALRIHAGQPNPRLYYAMKANRFAPLLTFLKMTELCGIDACSPAEVFHALGCGFSPGQISFTASSLSQNDYDLLAGCEGLHFNADSLHAIEEWGRRLPGTEIGIRINPATGVCRDKNQLLQYAGCGTTKFGIYREQFAEALERAASHRLRVTRIHFHTGCGYLTDQLPVWREVLEECRWFLDRVVDLQRVNIGGGLGVPHIASDASLDLKAWGAIIAECFTSRGLMVDIEPGDYLVKDAGLLLLGITFSEKKRDTFFLGVNGGFNIAPEPAYYRLPFQPVALYHAEETSRTAYHVAGNINEALDIWYEGALLPNMNQEQYLALINAGAYSAAMASNHCMRGDFREFLLL
jgi:diaminopimelate decarboxylase